ncbi:MAG: sensor histidine kinase [Spirochaetales bacterium]
MNSRDVEVGLRSESIVHLKIISEYVNSRLHHYEILLNTFPNLNRLDALLSLMHSDISRLKEVHNFFILTRDGVVVEAWKKPEAWELDIPLQESLGFSCHIVCFDGNGYLKLVQRFFNHPGQPAVVVILKTIELQPEHFLVPNPIDGIFLWDPHGYSKPLFRNPLLSAASPSADDALPFLSIGKKGTGVELFEDRLFAWDMLRNFPLGVFIIFNIQAAKNAERSFLFSLYLAGYGLITVLYLAGYWIIIRVNEAKRQSKELENHRAILREIHHRVKNNIHTITSLLDLQAYSTNNLEAKEALQTAIGRLQIIASLHEEMYRQDSFERVPLKDYLETLIHFMKHLYDTEQKEIKIESNIDPTICLNFKTTQSCGLIVHELITNSVKYAFPQGRKGTIRISLHQELKDLILTVEDDGVGFTGDPHKLPGLGMEIIQSMVNQLKGTLRFESIGGFRTILQIPMQTSTLAK